MQAVVKVSHNHVGEFLVEFYPNENC